MACTHLISPNNMTSNSLPTPYVASSWSNLNYWQLPFKAFDDSSVTVWASDYPLPMWLKIDLGTAQTACSYGLYSPGQNHPVDWTFEGSTNGVTNWVVLDTQADQDFDTDDWETTIDNENAYRYYRWNFTETSHTNIAIVKAKIYIETPPGVRDIIQQGCVPFRR